MPVNKEKSLIVIVGPTAVGKTALTVELALKFETHVINADSRQVYKEMSIGTAKPTIEEMSGIDHYFVDNISLRDIFSAGIFEREALQILNNIYSKSDIAIVSGGSGLYIDALCNGFDDIPDIDPEVRSELSEDYRQHGIKKLAMELEKADPDFWNIVDKKNPQRILRALEVIRTSGMPYSSFRKNKRPDRSFQTIKIGLDRPREELYRRINERVDNMIEAGLVDEVKSLQEYQNEKALQTVGYQEIFGYLNGDYDLDEAIRLLKRNSRRFAKRQLTWFRKDEEITWYHPDDLNEILQDLQAKLQN